MSDPTSASSEAESYRKRRHQRWHQAINERNAHLLLTLIEAALCESDSDGNHPGINLPPESCYPGLRAFLGNMRTRDDVLSQIERRLWTLSNGGIGGECKEVKVNE